MGLVTKQQMPIVKLLSLKSESQKIEDRKRMLLEQAKQLLVDAKKFTASNP